MQDTKIALLLSGGVDSCVALHLLCEQGYRPDLFYIYIGADEEMSEMSCTAQDDVLVCRMMARRYGLDFEIVNLHKQYYERVVGYMMEQVKRGFTPNSDVMCNRLIKFGCFDDEVGYRYDKIATGHYARVVERDGAVWMATAKDRLKDQTDFLCRIAIHLGRLMFPIGHLLKSEVRAIAAQAKLPSAARPDSQGICFLGKLNFTHFLNDHLGEREGLIVEQESGNVLGRHKGYWFYTIGQRKGLYMSGGPWFVVRKDVARNIIYVTRGDLSPARYRRTFRLAQLMPLGGVKEMCQLNGKEITFKIRHVQNFTPGRFILQENGEALVTSARDVSGVAPGQFCTLYDSSSDLCLGSGEIVPELPVSAIKSDGVTE